VRKPVGVLFGRLLPALIAAVLLTAGEASAGEKRVHVQGRIADPEGKGLSAQIVRLFKTRRSFRIQKFSSGGQIAEAARVTSDENGFFEIDVPHDRAFDDYYLRFYDPAAFDLVQYRLPSDREITKEIRRGETIRLDVTFERQPMWGDVVRRLEAAGPDSPKGRVLRSMGLPEREMKGEGPDGPREEWWYHTRGVVYFFRDGRPAGFRRFDPVAPAAPGPGSSGAEAPDGGA